MIKQFKVLAVALTAFGLASTATAGNMDVSGKSRMRMEQKSIGDEGQSDKMEFGAELNLKFTPDPKVLIFMQPKFYKIMGKTNTGANGASTAGSGLVDPGFDIHQAYMTLMHSDKISYTFGRYEMSYGDQLLIGAVPWDFVGRSFEGFKAHWTITDMIWADFIYNKTVEPGNTSDKDANLYGIYAGSKLSGPVSEVDLYYLVQDDRSTNTKPKDVDRTTIGVRAKGAAGMVDYRLEYTTQSGKNPGLDTSLEDANQSNAEVGFKLGDTRLAIEYFNASKNYNQLYPTGHKWLGYADLFGRRNINGLVGHVSHSFMEHMSVNLDYHTFNRTDTQTGLWGMANTNGTATYGTSVGNSKDVGSEIDLTISCDKMKSWVWTAGYSLFTAGQYWKDNVSSTAAPGTEVDDKVTYAYIMATANF